MTALFTYSLHAGIFLLFGYLAYSLFAADAMRPRFSRMLLWAVMLTSLLMPLCPELCLFTPDGADAAADMVIGRPEVVGIEAATRLSEFIKYIPALYMAGFLLSLAVMISAIIRLVMLLGKGRKERRGLITLVRLDREMSPFSWLWFIVMGNDDDKVGCDMVIAHEMSHIRRRHSLDLAVASVICALMWYNPAVWLWRRQLAMAHEYEADSDVVTAGFDMKSYQLLLIKKAVGPRLQSLANNLTHSKLKKRITMMSKKQSKRGALVRTLAVVPAIVGALAVVNIPAVASALDRFSPAEVQPFGEVNQNIVVTQASDETVALAAEEIAAPDDCLPEFPGGQSAMMQFFIETMSYPKQAEKDGIEGKVVVRFTVKTDGSISDVSVVKPINKALDDEAIRVVKAMPRWTPGRENGKTVAVSMSIPIEFKLK